MKGLILVYIITYGATVAGVFFPLIGLYVYVGLSVLRPQFIFGFAGDLTGLSVLVGYGLLAGWALKGFGSWRFGRAKPIVLALVVFTVWFSISAMWALSPAVSNPQIIVLLKLVLPFLVGATMMNGEKHWRPMLWTIVLAQGYVGFEQNLNYLKGFNTAAEGFGGMDNNFFAVSLISVIGPAVTLALTTKSWGGRLLAAAAAALILHTTLLTYSRGAMVGMLAIGAVAIIMMPKNPKYIGGMLIVLLLAARFTGPQLAERYATAFAAEDARDSSAESRVDLWRDCLKVVAEYPMMGVGPANWRVIAASYGWSAGKSAHSVWMETAAEVGIPGVGALLFFFVMPIFRLWPVARAKRTDTNEYEIALATGVILSIVGFVVGGQFVSAPSLEPPYYVVMLGVALLKTREARQAVVAEVPAQDVVAEPDPEPEPAPPFGVPPLRPQPAGRRFSFTQGELPPAAGSVPRRSDV